MRTRVSGWVRAGADAPLGDLIGRQVLTCQILSYSTSQTPHQDASRTLVAVENNPSRTADLFF
jgi:hypothetical protein